MNRTAGYPLSTWPPFQKFYCSLAVLMPELKKIRHTRTPYCDLICPAAVGLNKRNRFRIYAKEAVISALARKNNFIPITVGTCCFLAHIQHTQHRCKWIADKEQTTN